MLFRSGYLKSLGTKESRKTTLIEKYGRDIALPDLLHLVRASCPKMDRLDNDPCGVRYRYLAKLESRRPTTGFRPKGDVLDAVAEGLRVTRCGR